MDKTIDRNNLFNLIATLEKIYADKEMYRWGICNDYRCEIEAKLQRLYRLLSKMTEESYPNTT